MFVSATLIKPHLLSYKNRLFKRSTGTSLIQKDLATALVTLTVMFFVFLFMYGFLREISGGQGLTSLLPSRILNLAFLACFTLLIFSNIIGALGYFFFSKDLPLLLTAPISSFRLYLSRLTVLIINSSWIFAMFGVPSLLAYQLALDLHWTFLIVALAVSIPIVIIPAALASALMIALINIMPISRMRELVLLLALFLIFTAVFLARDPSIDLASSDNRIESLVNTVSILQDPHPYWLPSKWSATLLGQYLGDSTEDPYLLGFMLLLSTLGAGALGFLCFDLLFMRGWTKSIKGKRAFRVQSPSLGERFSRTVFPIGTQYRALLFKEARMFFRDPAQCFQLLMLLMLTFVYLYNFRALRHFSSVNSEINFIAQGVWKTILCLANISLGGCVVAAICTRFVFPSISLEGRAYWVVRAAPLEIAKLLRIKFFIWLLPISIISFVLLISGAWAIDTTSTAVLVCGFLALALSVGIAGVGIGVGAVYAKFDWDTTSEVATSFGSLVYMLLSLAVTMLTVLASSMLVILSSVPGLARQLGQPDYLVTICCSGFLVFFINFAAAKWALKAGQQALIKLER